MDLKNFTIKDIYQGYKKKQFSCKEITLAYLEKIKKENEELNTFITITEELALAQAEQADKKIASGNFSKLVGIPCAIKDSILVKGERCTCASKILENYRACYDATVIQKLKEEGCIILGKTNLDEFTMGASGENSYFGPTRNPWDKSRVAGGSSSGSAAAVAANQAVSALGSDTGGSIRLPASFCGVVGLNPTYGTVSRYGLIAHASSLDQIGPITKNVEDSKIVFKAICGRDERDATSVNYIFEDSLVDLSKIKIGIPREYFGEGLDLEIKKIIEKTIKEAEKAGAKIIEVSLPTTQYALACYYIIVPAEASSNLARFDGIKYGFSKKSETLLKVYSESRDEGFGPEPKRRIMLGTYSLSAGYYDAYYKKAQQVRSLIKEDFRKVFEKVDILFTPVSPFLAFKIGEKIENPLSMYLVDVYTVGVKLAGLPALSLPVGKINNLPVGLQIIGNFFQENKIFSVASKIEELLS